MSGPSILLVAGVLVLSAAVGCGAGSSATDSAAPVDVTPTHVPAEESPTPAPTLAPPAPVATQAKPTAASDMVSFTMPNLVGKDLQSAQNIVQTHGVFYSISHDLAGSRHQVIDSNWIVCDQKPAAGSRVSGHDTDLEGTIDFGVVKREERCP